MCSAGLRGIRVLLSTTSCSAPPSRCRALSRQDNRGYGIYLDGDGGPLCSPGAASSDGTADWTGVRKGVLKGRSGAAHAANGKGVRKGMFKGSAGANSAASGKVKGASNGVVKGPPKGSSR